jgi:hypothetical protein
MAVWDSAVDCNQNLVLSPSNEMELSAGPPRPVNYGERGKYGELFHKFRCGHQGGQQLARAIG